MSASHPHFWFHCGNDMRIAKATLRIITPHSIRVTVAYFLSDLSHGFNLTSLYPSHWLVCEAPWAGEFCWLGFYGAKSKPLTGYSSFVWGQWGPCKLHWKFTRTKAVFRSRSKIPLMLHNRNHRDKHFWNDDLKSMPGFAEVNGWVTVPGKH